jgi:hypothetical protein
MLKRLDRELSELRNKLKTAGLTMDYRMLDDSPVSKDGKVIGIVPRKYYLSQVKKLKEIIDIEKALELYKGVKNG